MADGFKIDDSFFKELGNSPAVVEETRRHAESILKVAKLSAPYNTGAYQKSLKIVPIKARFRTVFSIQAECDHSMIVQAKTSHLAKAIKRVG